MREYTLYTRDLLACGVFVPIILRNDLLSLGRRTVGDGSDRRGSVSRNQMGKALNISLEQGNRAMLDGGVRETRKACM